jgi:hypothetical protein
MDAKKPEHSLACGIDYADSCAACRQLWDSLGYGTGGPRYPLHRLLFQRLVEIVGHLKKHKGLTDITAMPARDEQAETAALVGLCFAEMREAFLTALAPGIRALVRDELRRASEGGG